MNNDKQVEKRVICAIERGYNNSDSDVGKLRAYYEILPTNEAVPINSTDNFFCNTEQVFVTGQFTELKDKFDERLFEAKCVHSNYDTREGDCKYVTRLSQCVEIKGLVCSQLFDSPLPNISDTVLMLDKKPLTKTILLRNSGIIYGPFEYTNEIDHLYDKCRLQLKAISTPLNSTPQYHIGKIGMHQCMPHLYEKGGFPVFLANIKRCFEHAELIDYITDEQIISTYGSKVAQNSEIRSFNKGTIAQIRKSFASSLEYKKFPERFKRLFEALDTANHWEGSRKELIDNFLNIPSGKKILESYIDSNKELFLKDEKLAYLKKMQLDRKDLIEELKDLSTKKEKIEADTRKSLRQREEMELNAELSIETLSEQQKKKFDDVISDKKNELDSLETEISVLQDKHSRFTKMEAIEQEIKELDRDKERLQKRFNDMNTQVEDVAKQLRSSNEELTARLLELKPHVDALSGIATKPAIESVNYGVPVRTFESSRSDDDIREELIDEVLESLNSLGRKTDYNTVANLLTTIFQSQFTLFSGRPGTGKTSLAKMLGSSLGLQNRVLNIPVARGWTSSRDILGFFNALSSSFTSASTGLYELLTHLNKEVENGSDAAPSICLLDEFNLSQPEHYFSPFLEMSDPESKRIIVTGDHSFPNLKVPKYLRFLGTINNDESVQSLTPRMLDRAAIISFDSIEHDYELSLNSAKKFCDLNIKAVSGNKLIELFTPRSLELPQEIEHTLKLIIDTLRDEKPDFGSPVNISFRKVMAIRSYHSVTSSMYIDSRFIALDYAISQHVITLLNGYGQNFGNRLKKLLEVIPDEMQLSHKMLKRIIETGDQNMSTYGFNI